MRPQDRHQMVATSGPSWADRLHGVQQLPALASPVSSYLSECGVVNVDGDSKQSLFQETLLASLAIQPWLWLSPQSYILIVFTCFKNLNEQ